MTVFTREQLKNQIRENKIAPVYLFFGEETYLRDLAVKAITDKVFNKDDAMRPFNDSSVNLTTANIKDALRIADQFPMMSEKRVIRIVEVRISNNEKKDTLRENDLEGLSDYLNNPNGTSVVFFVAEEFDKRRKIAKLLLEKCVAVDFSVKEDEAIKWCKDHLKDFHVRADERTLRYLMEMVGADLRKISSELEKLAVASLPDGIITTELIDELVSYSREWSNFALTDHLLAKNRARALQTVHKLLDDGAEPVMLLGLIASNYHRLALVKDLMKKGLDRKDVARAVNMPYSKQEEFMAAARRLEWEKLTHILRRMSEVDLAIKTSVATPRLQIEMLVCELTA